jgi:hypothetical protein
MKKGNGITLRFFSTLLVSVLITSAVVSAPASFAADETLITTEAELIAAGINPNAVNLRIMADINLNSKLVINHSLTMTCGDTCTAGTRVLTGQGLEITSGAVVTLSRLTLNGLTGLAGQPSYGISIRDGSHLNASYLNMSYNQTGLNANVSGFNVLDRSTLTLSDSSLTWGSNVAGLQQYGVYAQSGANAVNINNSNFDFSSENTPGAYSCLIGVDGALVANYPQLNLLNLNSNSYLKLQASGADTIGNKQNWANPNVSAVAGNNRVGFIGTGYGAGIYTRNAQNWAVNAIDAIIIPDVSTVNYVGYTLTSTTDTIFVDLADSYGYQFAYIDVKKQVLVSGKLLWRYVPVDLVVLDAYGRAIIKTLVGIKLGDTLRVSMAGNPDNVVVRWQLVK